jgi:hypothetical protein
MTYIIDLILIMQNVFWLTEGKDKISDKLLHIAFEGYKNSEVKGDVHFMVSEHVKNVVIAKPGARDASLEKITEILKKHQIKPEDMFELRKGFDVSKLEEPQDPQ